MTAQLLENTKRVLLVLRYMMQKNLCDISEILCIIRTLKKIYESNSSNENLIILMLNDTNINKYYTSYFYGNLFYEGSVKLFISVSILTKYRKIMKKLFELLELYALNEEYNQCEILIDSFHSLPDYIINYKKNNLRKYWIIHILPLKSLPIDYYLCFFKMFILF